MSTGNMFEHADITDRRDVNMENSPIYRARRRHSPSYRHTEIARQRSSLNSANQPIPDRFPRTRADVGD